MSQSPLVTAIVPTYNRGSLVGGAIESIRRQTYRNIEIIVVDDGSTDDTQERLRSYIHEVRVVRQDNAGPSSARNRGIALAQGEIVAFLDSDDAWHPTKLERQVRLLEQVDSSVPCCLCNAVIESPSGTSTTTFEYAGLSPRLEEGIWENVIEVLMTRFVMFTQMVAVRRAALNKIGGFDESLRLMEDYDLALRLSLEGPWLFVDEPLVTYRQESPGSLASAARFEESRAIESSLRACQKFYDRVKEDRHHSRVWLSAWRSLSLLRLQRLGSKLTNEPWPGSAFGRAMLLGNRFFRALHRRSPWYPEMRVAPFAGSRHHEKV